MEPSQFWQQNVVFCRPGGSPVAGANVILSVARSGKAIALSFGLFLGASLSSQVPQITDLIAIGLFSLSRHLPRELLLLRIVW